MVVKSLTVCDSEGQHQHLLTLGKLPETVCLIFLICEMGLTEVPTAEGHCEDRASKNASDQAWV